MWLVGVRVNVRVRVGRFSRARVSVRVSKVRVRVRVRVRVWGRVPIARRRAPEAEKAPCYIRQMDELLYITLRKMF